MSPSLKWNKMLNFYLLNPMFFQAISLFWIKKIWQSKKISHKNIPLCLCFDRLIFSVGLIILDYSWLFLIIPKLLSPLTSLTFKFGWMRHWNSLVYNFFDEFLTTISDLKSICSVVNSFSNNFLFPIMISIDKL